MKSEEIMITLRDLENRDGDNPYEFTDTIDGVWAYIDGPLRSDLTDDHDEELADIRRAIERGDLRTANDILRPMSVHLRAES